MPVYDVSLQVTLRLQADGEEEAECLLALLIKSLEAMGADVVISEFAETQKGK